LHDYRCAECGTVLADQYRSIAEGASSHPPLCPDCGEPMAWIPAIGCMDAFEPGGEFTVYDGQNRPVHVESFAQMRKLERQSEQQYRNGEGQPIRFRALHQHRSNMQENTFGPAPNETPTPAAAQKFGGRQRAIAGGEDGAPPDVAFGPGVNESNASALKEA
jgi:hypothetical protein